MKKKTTEAAVHLSSPSTNNEAPLPSKQRGRPKKDKHHSHNFRVVTENEKKLHKQLEKQKILSLTQNEKTLFYEKLFSSMGAIVYVLDIQSWKLVYVNEAFNRILGYKPQPQQLSLETMLENHHPDDHELFTQMPEYFKTNKSGTYTSIYRLKNAQGEYHWFINSSRIFRKKSDNSVLEVIGVLVDMTKNLDYDKNLKKVSKEKFREINAYRVEAISQRERQIVKLFANGYKSKEIAEKLGISFHTVNNHRKNILKRLNLKNLAALVNFAVENGLD